MWGVCVHSVGSDNTVCVCILWDLITLCVHVVHLSLSCLHTNLFPLLPALPPPVLAGYEMVTQKSEVAIASRAAPQKRPQRRSFLCVQNKIRALSFHRSIQVGNTVSGGAIRGWREVG